ncbi:MAG: hypothetical protein H7122_06580 [Chitinophagaceae bacterium]|nr:hypothetical protein [Chitinophagaceae bacterium]
MKYHDYLNMIPAQYSGKEIEAGSDTELKDIEEAKTFYSEVKNRLLNVNNWHEVAGMISAKFQLVDASGKEVTRSTEKGDYLKIDIPGPGSKAGDGYDWALVEELNELNNGDNQSVGFRVRPCENPLGDKRETAHFYSDESTSNFIVTREGKKVSAWIIDRNIKPNQDAESITDQIRDSTVGIGALGLFSKVQWQALADAFVKNKK